MIDSSKDTTNAVSSRPSYLESALPERSLFASQSVAVHLIRGVIGIAALGLALSIAKDAPLASVVLALVALLAFRGCPMCWTIGLAETLYQQWQKRRVLS
jgi:hypothetical protein